MNHHGEFNIASAVGVFLLTLYAINTRNEFATITGAILVMVNIVFAIIILTRKSNTSQPKDNEEKKE